MKTCRSCGAEILWAVTENGKRIPLDSEPVEIPRGLFELSGVTADGARIALSAPELRQSHFASCPNAASHRKREPEPDYITEGGPS